MLVNLDLVKKYNVPAPRYTSYPTALQFKTDENFELLSQQMREDIAHSGNTISLYIHIPFCKSLCWYCGCTTVPAKDENAADAYIDCLEKEIILQRSCLETLGKMHVAQLHFGGGTPSALTPAQIDRVSAILREHFIFDGNAEISVELDPRTASKEIIAAFARLGCTRASLGVQDLNSRTQVAIHRVQPLPVVAQCVAWLRELGFTSINFDLIYGLPYQSVGSFQETLTQTIALKPDRFSIFSYAHVPWIKPQQKLLEATGALPDPDLKLTLLKTIIERLCAENFVYIGLDHFARPDDELVHALRERRLQRNFQGYSTHAGTPIVALGMSSISQSSRTFSQNEKDYNAYCAAINQGKLPTVKGLILNDEDLRRREIISKIMCDLQLDYDAMSAHFGFDFSKRYANEIAKLEPLAADGLIEPLPHGNGFAVTQTGRLFIRLIALPFDGYFNPAGTPKHAKSI